MEREPIFAVYVEHEAEKCPAEDPERAKVIVPNLREVQPLTGVFIPPHHKGVSLIEGGMVEDAIVAHETVLPDHLEPVVVELDRDEQITTWLEHPTALDGIDAHHEFLWRMDQVPEFKKRGLDAPINNQSIKTKSLAQLPEYIAEKILAEHGVTV